MKKSIPEEGIHHTAAALDVVQTGSYHGAYIGLDVHKETIAVAGDLTLFVRHSCNERASHG